MREIPGRHRRLRSGHTAGSEAPEVPDLSEAALVFADEWKWPVLPGAGAGAGTRGQRRNAGAGTSSTGTGADTDTRSGTVSGSSAATGSGADSGTRTARAGCACPDPECALAGAHPFEPGLLSATTDARMVGWWWGNRPGAPILLATGEGAGPCAVSLPAVAGPVTLAALDGLGRRLGPVVAGPERWAILVAPYDLERLGALLYAKDSVPGALRFHGTGGYLALPPSTTGAGQVRWARGPLPGSARPWLPDVEAVVDAVVDTLTRTGVSAPEL